MIITGFLKKRTDRIYLVNAVFIVMEMLGEVDLFALDGFTFNGKIISGIKGIYENIDILGVEFCLFETVGKPLCRGTGEKSIQAADNIKFIIIHRSLLVVWIER